MYDRKITLLTALCSVIIFTPALMGAEEVNLQFLHVEGQVLHADSLVDETVYIDGRFSHQAEVDEFSVSTIRQVSPEGKATLDSSFRTVERVRGMPGILEWISAETVRLERDAQGKMTVPPEASRPVLRNVPRFPVTPVKPGDTWSLPAEEVHVFRISNVIYGPYRGPVQVLYRYLQNKIIDGRRFAEISVEYSIYMPVRSSAEPIRLITGQSSQRLLWDIEKGRPGKKQEDFEFLMLMADGRTQEFRGRGETSYRINDSIDRPRAVQSLQTELESVPGVTIEPTTEGILLSIIETDRILFQPDSSEVTMDQRYRLEELAHSLAAYPERDILITGHTADYGSFEGRKNLSRNRAAAVADILFPGGRTGQGRLFLRGAGNTEPLGSDQENRRVEILILD
ncbi:OmpA family protein [Oceanispirochaeta sp.]|jgi:flagellar motor protein MotB|uniref:OmpA family protein n=1 Tax=Oceanispirochaeta sp. TaxID=2035350 RepID=UPI002617048F|nr:OmpA family protein [Oceanispirochaeta sp.]MDA3956209.1 OmpA family protein [Oceanispirochaeta sp.]